MFQPRLSGDELRSLRRVTSWGRIEPQIPVDHERKLRALGLVQPLAGSLGPTVKGWMVLGQAGLF